MSFELVPLGSVCHLIGGGTPAKSTRAFYEGDIPWATVRDMKADLITATEFRITSEAVRESATNILPAGTVVIATRVGLGKVSIVERATAINQDLRGVVPKKGAHIDPRFLFWWLKSVAHLIVAEGTGATVQGVKVPFVASLPFPAISLSEQQRIVAILDEALGGIAAATVPAQVGLARARDLPMRMIRHALKRNGTSWDNTTIGAQITLQRGVDITKASQRPGTVPVVSSGGIRSYHDEALVKAPGVVMGRKGTLGKVFYLDRDFWPHDTSLYVKDFKGNDVRFVYYFLKGLDVSGLDSGAANPALNRNTVHALGVRWPPLEVQKSIAAQIDGVSQHADRLVDLYERKLSALVELKQSLLDRAFSGELAVKAATTANDNTFATPEQVANILAIIHWRHERAHRSKTYGHVKAQKALHLVESVGGVNLGRQPIKDAAGPNDFAHMKEAEAWAKHNGFFEFVPRGTGYDFRKLANHARLLGVAKEAVRPIAGAIDRVNDLIVLLDSDATEVLATVHAAWNNVIASGQEATPEAIVREARDEWHPNKMLIPESKFREAIRLIKAKGIIPDGTGRPVLHLQPSLL